jgi:hypothetical protein
MDVLATYDELCTMAIAEECRRYFVVLTLHGYATFEIYQDLERRKFLMGDYIRAGKTRVQAEMLMLCDLERCMRRSNSSLERYRFPKPGKVPTELQEAIGTWKNELAYTQQLTLLEQLNCAYPNNEEQAAVFDKIMDSILKFHDTPREDLAHHTFHLISGLGGTGKMELFRKCHAA